MNSGSASSGALTVIVSVIVALLSGALVAYLNGLLMQMRENIKLYRDKAESIFSAMNHIVAVHSIVASDLTDINNKSDVEDFLSKYGLRSDVMIGIFLDNGVVNTMVSIYFRDNLSRQQAVSYEISNLCYQAIEDGQSLLDLDGEAFAARKMAIIADVSKRYKSFNDTCEALSAGVLGHLSYIEDANTIKGSLKHLFRAGGIRG